MANIIYNCCEFTICSESELKEYQIGLIQNAYDSFKGIEEFGIICYTSDISFRDDIKQISFIPHTKDRVFYIQSLNASNKSIKPYLYDASIHRFNRIMPNEVYYKIYDDIKNTLTEPKRFSKITKSRINDICDYYDAVIKMLKDGYELYTNKSKLVIQEYKEKGFDIGVGSTTIIKGDFKIVVELTNLGNVYTKISYCGNSDIDKFIKLISK